MLQESRYHDVRIFQLSRPLFGRRIYHTACFALGDVLVDAGCAHTVRELVAALADRTIAVVAVSHSHEDHVAAAAALARRDGARVVAHPLTVPILRDPRLRGPLHPYRRILWGGPEPVAAQPVGSRLDVGDHHFEVLHTPGHAPDHLVLFEASRGWAFTADLFVGGRDRAARPDANVSDLLLSLRRLRALEPAVLFPGSGRLRERPAAELAEKISFLEELQETVRSRHRAGTPVAVIRRELFGRRMAIEIATLGDFAGENLVRACLKEATWTGDSAP